jgi:hypothetical protein
MCLLDGGNSPDIKFQNDTVNEHNRVRSLKRLTDNKIKSYYLHLSANLQEQWVSEELS